MCVVLRPQAHLLTGSSRSNEVFAFPLHNHDEFELNFLTNARGVKRIVGDHTECTDYYDLVLVGSNLPHGWFDPRAQCPQVREITIQFHWNLFDDKFLKRNQLSFIRTLLERSAKGVLFSQEMAERIRPPLEAVSQKNGSDSMLELMSILHDLSTPRDIKTLSNTGFSGEQINYNSRRIEKAFNFMNENYDRVITLADVARVLNMNEVAFCRFIKKRTGKTFIESLNEIRLGQASRLLIETTHTIAEVTYRCGFNNLSYFNRIFRSKNGCTPSEFRTSYSGTRVLI